MLNTIQKENLELQVKLSQYEQMPSLWVANDFYSIIRNSSHNSEVLESFDYIPQEKLPNVLKSYRTVSKNGLFSDMYILLGIGIRDLKPRIFHILNLVSFKDGEKRKMWKLYENLNDYDDFIEEHNSGIINKLDDLLQNLL